MSVPLHVSTLRTDGRTHVLFVIDQLCEMGGAERVLLNTIRLLPKERYRCSLITFKIDSRLNNGLELDKILRANGAGQLRASLSLEPTAPVVTTVGNIRRVKGIDILVETAAKVLCRFPKAVFLVIGRNSEPLHFQEIEERIAALGIKERVRFLGESENIFPLL